MDALVIFESMYGNTHAIADHIATGLVAAGIAATTVAARDVAPHDLVRVDLVVLGAPTHAHRLPSATTRRAAMKRPPSGRVDPAASGPGIRDLLDGATSLGVPAPPAVAAFDTRAQGPRFLTGRASASIARTCRKLGWPVVAAPESFIVDGASRLIAGEAERAERWARDVATAALERQRVM